MSIVQNPHLLLLLFRSQSLGQKWSSGSLPLTLVLGHKTLNILLENTLSKFIRSKQEQIILFPSVLEQVSKQISLSRSFFSFTSHPKIVLMVIKNDCNSYHVVSTQNLMGSVLHAGLALPLSALKTTPWKVDFITITIVSVIPLIT